MCGKDTSDPIADRIYAEDDFMILRHGRSRAEVKPGDIIRIPADKREAVYENARELFVGLRTFSVTERPYRRLGRSTKSSLSGGIAASLSQTVSTQSIGKATIKALAEKMKAATLDVSLSGCLIQSINVPEFEKSITRAGSTPLFDRYEKAQQTFAVVTETLTASKVIINFDESQSGAIMGALDAETLASIALKLDEKASKSAQIEMDPIDEAVVVAVKATQIIRTRDGFGLQGFKKRPRKVKQKQDEEETEVKTLDLTTDNILVEIAMPSVS